MSRISTGERAGVPIEIYRGPRAAMGIAIVTAQHMPAPLARPADDDVPQRHAFSGVLSVARYALRRFVTLWLLVPFFLIMAFFEVSHGIPLPPPERWRYHQYHCGIMGCTIHRIKELYSAYNFNTLDGPKLLLTIIALLLLSGWLISSYHQAEPPLRQ